MFKFGIFVCLIAVAAGEDVTESVFKIYKNEKPACLATLIKYDTGILPAPFPGSKQTLHFVTAAHCVRGAQGLTIKAGKNGEKINVDRVILHPYYKPPNVNYDIAVLRAKLSGQYSGLIPSEVPPTGGNILQTYCLTEKDTIKETKATVIGLRDCQTRLGNSTKLSSKMLCTSANGVMDGSPLAKVNDKNKTEIFGVAFFSAQGTSIFTNMANSEISSFIKLHVDV